MEFGLKANADILISYLDISMILHASVFII